MVAGEERRPGGAFLCGSPRVGADPGGSCAGAKGGTGGRPGARPGVGMRAGGEAEGCCQSNIKVEFNFHHPQDPQYPHCEQPQLSYSFSRSPPTTPVV